MAWFIKHRTDIPEMGSIVADVPGLHPSFTPEVQNYASLGLDYRSIFLAFRILKHHEET